MKFMTAASVSNLPGYLQDDANRAKLNDAREIARFAQEEKLAKQQRVRELGAALAAWNDWTAKGVQKFAQTYNVTSEELPDVVQAVATFKEKLKDATRTDEYGNVIAGGVTESGEFRDYYRSSPPKYSTIDEQDATGNVTPRYFNEYSGVGPTIGINKSIPKPEQRAAATEQGGQISYPVNPYTEGRTGPARITALPPTSAISEVDNMGGTTTRFVNPNNPTSYRTGLPSVENVEVLGPDNAGTLKKIYKQTGKEITNLGKTTLTPEEELANKAASGSDKAQNFILPSGEPVLSYDNRTYKDKDGNVKELPPGTVKASVMVSGGELELYKNKQWASEKLADLKSGNKTPVDYKEAAVQGTGPYAKGAAAIDAMIGGFFGTGTIFKDTQDSRQALRLITQLGKSALANSKRYPVKEMEIVAELFPDPNKFFASPETESRKFDKLIDILEEERIYNLEAMKTASSDKEASDLKTAIRDGDRLLNILAKKNDTPRFKILKVE